MNRVYLTACEEMSIKFNNCFDNVIVEKKSKLEYNIIPNIQL